MRKTKIICTLGPSTDNETVLRNLMLSGMNVARLNFSHQTHEEQKVRADMVKRLREELNLPIALLLDTKGPEIRLTTFEQPKIQLQAGEKFTLTTRDIVGTDKIGGITFAGLPQDVQPGARILIDDGLIELRAEACTDTDIICTIINGGTISARKGINVPGVHLSLPFISEQDRKDIAFAVENDFDFIAASFTRSADDILEMREELEKLGSHNIRIIAKIENYDGVDNIDEIIRVADGIMVARGDLGVEIPLQEIPSIQKRLIKKAYLAGRQVITATQMLDSMIKNPRPTRAETTDVANAIYQGTSAIMLSGETAAGKYPVEALRTMVKIAIRTEADIPYNQQFSILNREHAPNMTTAISHATCMTAIDLRAKAIITVSRSGNTARMISKYRPGCLIVGCSPEEHTCRQLNMSWGITPVLIKEEYSMEILLLHATEAAERAGYVEKGDIVVLTAGVPLGRSGNTNLLKTTIVGEY